MSKNWCCSKRTTIRLVTGGVVASTHPTTERTRARAATRRMKKHFLAILAIYRDECSILKEWLEHHVWQGVDFFYLIDNLSKPSQRCSGTIRAFQSRIWRFSWTDTPQSVSNKSSNQLMAYAMAFPYIETEWLLVSDLDEFLLGVNDTAAEVLRMSTSDEQIAQVCLPWVRFGSSNLTRTPPCVTRSNIVREPLRAVKPRLGKCLTRGRALSASGLQIHRSKVDSYEPYVNKTKCVCGDLKVRCRNQHPKSTACSIIDGGHANLDPGVALSKQRLLLHHYQVQSKQHMKERSAFGDVNVATWQKPEWWWALTDQQFSVTIDRTLADRTVCTERRAPT